MYAAFAGGEASALQQLGERRSFGRRERAGVFRLDHVGRDVGIGRRADPLEIGDRVGVSLGASPREQLRIARRVLALPMDHLARADARGHEIRAAARDCERQDAAARNAEQHDALLREPHARVLDHRDAVAHEALDAERARGRVAVLRLRRAAARLVPLHDREVALPAREQRCPRAQRRAGAAEHEQSGDSRRRRRET